MKIIDKDKIKIASHLINKTNIIREINTIIIIKKLNTIIITKIFRDDHSKYNKNKNQSKSN